MKLLLLLLLPTCLCVMLFPLTSGFVSAVAVATESRLLSTGAFKADVAALRLVSGNVTFAQEVCRPFSTFLFVGGGKAGFCW